MPEITLQAEVGRESGTSVTRRLRAAGRIPGVVYGHGTEPLSVSVEARALRTALNGESGTNALLSLEAGGQTFLTLARELQRHPVMGTVTHVDFQIVRRDEIITAEVPLVIIGEALEVHHGDGLVDQQLFTLPVRAKPADIPTSVEVDVSALVIGGAIRVADLPLPPGVTVDLEADVTIVTGQPPRIQVTGTEGEEAEATADGAVVADGESSSGESAGGE